ncbi:MAG: hypothetical protein COA37_15220 [Hoeflea sp.]|uniref:hypothetical protein n=1 Tax=Hoeflea sp. TaxID=1940281 RepID=UPI000C1043DE|nr:hypothetical protein [Hoeflea sp.]PHR20382.1 MAG: hypothetical protein COA37_15220 [Hoeflea sp.]
MADLSHKFAAVLVVDTQTDITGGGCPVGAAGAYTLNIVNDTDGEASLTAVYLTTGGAAAAADKIHPAFTIEARGWAVIQPIKIGEGWKLFVESDTAVSVNLIGRKEG